MARGSRGGGRPSGGGVRGYTLRGKNRKINYVGLPTTQGGELGSTSLKVSLDGCKRKPGPRRAERPKGGKPIGSRRTGTIMAVRTHLTTGPKMGRQYRAAGISVPSPCLCER